MAARRRFEDSDSDDSDGSVSSTWTTQSEEKTNYPVDQILAEKEDEESHDMLFLVKWTGYDKSRCTWEPACNFSAPTMEQWVSEKNAIKLGFRTAFPVKTWEHDQKRKAENDRRRWQRRRAMLKKRPDCNRADPPKSHPAFDEDSDSDMETPEPLVFSPPRTLLPGAGRKTSVAQSRSRLKAAAGRNARITQECKEKRRGTDIMADYAREPPAKRSRKPADENQQYKNVEKKGRDGAVPRVEDIQALLARPGEIHSLAQSNLTRDGSQSGLSRTEPCQEDAFEGPVAPHAETIPLTCFYWYNRFDCPHGKEQCRFTHGDCDRIADQALHLQVSEDGTTGWKPKFWSPTKVCFFWNKGGCHQGDTGCWFAHWRPRKFPWVVYSANDEKRNPRPIAEGNHGVLQAELVAPSGPRKIPYERTQGIIKQPCRFWESVGCRDGPNCKWMHGYVEPAAETAQQTSVPKPAHIPPGKIPKTCPYWYYRQNCKKSAESCDFVHGLLEDIGEFGRPLKICPFWLDGNRCIKPASDCKFLHYHAEGIPVGEIPSGRSRGQNAQPTSNMIPQAPPGFFDPSNQMVPSNYPIFDNGIYAPEDPAGYAERLAQESAERAHRKTQVTQAHRPQTPPIAIPGNISPILDAPPPALADMASDSSSESMDVGSGIMESPDTLDTIDSPNTFEVSLQVSDVSKSIPVEIADVELTAMDALKADYPRGQQIVVSQMVMRDLLETFIFPLAPTVLSSGKIFEMQGQDMTQLARILTEQSSVAIAQGLSSLLILYPSHLMLEELVFLERGLSLMEPNCHIYVQVRAVGNNFPTSIPYPPSAGLPKTLERYFYKNHGWEPAKFFAWHNGQHTSKTAKNVYLMTHHMSHKAETEILARYFRELGAQVWTTGTKGSWDNFLKLAELKGSGVVIMHPDFVRYEGIPNLRRLLMKSFNMFQMRVSMKEGIPERLNIKKIMLSGTCTLLMDEMYMKCPKESLDLLKLIVQKNEGKKKKNDRTWGVYGPPQLADWLFNLFGTKEDEREEDQPKLQLRMNLYDQVQLLEDDRDDDDDDAGPGAPLLSSDIEVAASEIPKGIPEGHTAYDAYRNENPAGAARKLLEAFATASLEWTEQYRRVIVIIPPGEVVDPELKKVYDEWEASSKAQHISFWTPDRFMSCFKVK
ncbi:putative 4-coumarate--CoA ligase 3 [Venturia nashicola]|uniref:Putative 4-coumarate--CoA ligase 3 n=1 Tax=Venturia nashicola TaxID=86259 RepID=A0A4Z1PNN8_9PEZI|nr:putative 4-coumarate--CoA ligase 3 [Venturia nashicola]